MKVWKFSLFHYNLIILKSKIILWKWAFFYWLYIVLIKLVFNVFLSFQVKIWLMAMIQALLFFFRLSVKLKKYRASLCTFHMLVKTSVKECRVYFFIFLDSLKVDYEKGNPFTELYLSSFQSPQNTKNISKRTCYVHACKRIRTID